MFENFLMKMKKNVKNRNVNVNVVYSGQALSYLANSQARYSKNCLQIALLIVITSLNWHRAYRESKFGRDIFVNHSSFATSSDCMMPQIDKRKKEN